MISQHPEFAYALTIMACIKHMLFFGGLLSIGILYTIAVTYMQKQDELFHQPVPANTSRIFIGPYGRLGNCLFKLAASYGIAQMNHRKLVMTPGYINRIKHFLNVSHLNVEIAQIPERIKSQPQQFYRFKPEMEHIQNSDVKLGYIQVMTYFLPYASLLRDRLVINDNLVSSTQDYLHSLHVPSNSTFVGIHVRRGDRASKRLARKGQLIPRPPYLKNAMTYFLSKYTNVHFIVCSDEIDWCRRNETYLQKGMLNSIAKYDVHFSLGKSAEWDMALLAQCNHSIVTVGTYGWWGSWFAGGETIYFNRPFKKGSFRDGRFIDQDYFWPTWVGMDDK